MLRLSKPTRRIVMLCLHVDSVRVGSRDALAEIPTPNGNGRWKPVPHLSLANAAVERASRLGLEVEKEEWGVSRKNGAKLFGVLNFKPIAKLCLPPGMGPSMGLRSSLDKSIAINVCVGARVFVCDNGVFTGDFSLRKLHTTGFQLDRELDGAFRLFGERVGAVGRMVGLLQGRSLSDNEAKVVMFDAFRAGVMPWRHAREVSEQYFEPTHEAFKPRNAWSLYNSFTEIVKQRGPSDQIRTFRALNDMLLKAVEKN
jgi:hypothetical protein